MTAPMELVGRLEKLREEPSRFVFEVNSILTEAAACIREMVEEINRLNRVLEINSTHDGGVAAAMFGGGND